MILVVGYVSGANCEGKAFEDNLKSYVLDKIGETKDPDNQIDVVEQEVPKK